ncbi:PIR Superfamily Protein [Plasmodium ovale wallikeri]|uniref:PIR Superfamily Protein n=1 Tax=Plasmodium ovale wallikeri TaxID=864142 RepID=A0A1A9ACH4_PLAOA|nr:PIR Superfamily Protein [Plasmodium ovale wallikeri]SBT53834.1 PIR Superfamily Protein [Plasmodium ovale wallikeri]
MLPQQRSMDFSSSKELISEKFYDAMNSDYSDLSKYSQKCNEITVKSSKIWNEGNSQYDISILLNYWIYEKLTGIYGDDDNDKITSVFIALQYVWQYYNYTPKIEAYHQKCNPNIDVVNHPDWNKRKEFYDYCIDYNTLYVTATNYDNKCEEYYKIIRSKIPLYQYFGQKCLTDQNNCPIFYKQCERYNPESFISILPCHSEIQKKEAAAKASERHSPSEKELGTRAHGYGSELPGIESGIHDTESTFETTEIGKKVGHSVLGVAPVLLAATALYRYTAVGSCIRKFGGYSPDSINDTNGGVMEEFLDNMQGSGNIFFGRGENYISYQPL